MKRKIGCLMVAFVLCGCAERRDTDLFSERAPVQTRESARPNESQPLALVNGQPVTYEQLNAALLEIAGGEALAEHVLDLMLADEARRRGVQITPDDFARERQQFLDTLVDAGLAPAPQDAEAMLATVRQARGLGPSRFDQLLRRSALLRAMVRDDVEVTDAMIALAHEIEHGEKHRIRVLATHSLRDAQTALEAIENGATFGEAAARYSTDASAARGGVVEPVSAADPTYPESVRSAMTRLTIGRTSPPIVVDEGFVILQLEGIDPPSGRTLDATRDTIERRVRRQQERLKMAELAERLRRRAQTTVLDPHLRFSNQAR